MKRVNKTIKVEKTVLRELYNPAEEQAIKHLHLALSDLLSANYDEIECRCEIKEQVDTHGFVCTTNPFLYGACAGKCGYYRPSSNTVPCVLARMAETITDLYGKVR